MIKNTLKTFSICFCTFLISANPLYAETYGNYKYDHQLTSVIEINSDDFISIYNTGLSLDMENENGFKANFRGSIDGKIDEINSKDFELGTFIKQLSMSYEVDTKNALVLLSVGKMPVGVKTNAGPQQPGGVMGIRLSVEPEKIPLIQDWLTKNNFKINRIDITRYNSASEKRIDLRDLSETNMTAYALYLSKGHNIQTFFIYKAPDTGNEYGVTSKTLGAVYLMNGKLKPQFFAMGHKSNASFLDLDLLVLSASVEVAQNVRSAFTYSRVIESMSDTEKNIYDFSVSKTIKKNKKFNLQGTFGVRAERGNSDDEVVYSRLEIKY